MSQRAVKPRSSLTHHDALWLQCTIVLWENYVRKYMPSPTMCFPETVIPPHFLVSISFFCGSCLCLCVAVCACGGVGAGGCLRVCVGVCISAWVRFPIISSAVFNVKAVPCISKRNHSLSKTIPDHAKNNHNGMRKSHPARLRATSYGRMDCVSGAFTCMGMCVSACACRTVPIRPLTVNPHVALYFRGCCCEPFLSFFFFAPNRFLLFLHLKVFDYHIYLNRPINIK